MSTPAPPTGSAQQFPPPNGMPARPETQAAPPATPAAASPPAPPITPYGVDDKGRVKRTKISSAWVGLIAAGIVLILLIIFIGQNLNKVGVHFLGFYGQVSVGLALLVAAIFGLLIAAVPGSIRILQLRKALRRNVAELTAGKN